MVRGSFALWQFIHETYGKSSFSSDMLKRDPQRTKTDKRMEMSPVICKQMKKGLKRSRREGKGGGTDRTAAKRQSFENRNQAVGDPFCPRVQLARGCSCVVASGRKDKETARKKKRGGRRWDTHEGSGYSSVTHVLGYFATVAAGYRRQTAPRVLAFGNQLDIHKHRQSGRKTEKGMENGWEVFAADIMLSKGAPDRPRARTYVYVSITF